MNQVNITLSRFNTYERLYRLLFYILCISLLVSSVIKFGGALNKTKIGIGEIKFRLDHVLHAVAYFIFSMYYILGHYFGLRLFKKRNHLFFFFLLFAVGFLAEAIQIWVPYRSFTLLDLLSNLVGIGAGWGITAIFLRKRYDGMTV
jgi:VanZ family protein